MDPSLGVAVVREGWPEQGTRSRVAWGGWEGCSGQVAVSDLKV